MVPKRTNEALDDRPEQNGKRQKAEEPEHVLPAPQTVELQLALALPAPQSEPNGVEPQPAPAQPAANAVLHPQGVPNSVEPQSAAALLRPQPVPQQADPQPAHAQPADALPPQQPLPLKLEQQQAIRLPTPQPVLIEPDAQAGHERLPQQPPPSSLQPQPAAAHALLHQGMPKGMDPQSALAEPPSQTEPQDAEPQPAHALPPTQPVLKDLDAQPGHERPPQQADSEGLQPQPTHAVPLAQPVLEDLIAQPGHEQPPTQTVLRGVQLQPKHQMPSVQAVLKTSASRPAPALPPLQAVLERSEPRPAAALPPLQAVPKGLELPSGWRECPEMGARMHMLSVVPTKVPLGRNFRRVLTEEQHFSPERLVQTMRAKGSEVGLIIDLTNSWRYYDLDEVTCLGVEHIKIRCKGRGEAPEPQAVNQFAWELLNYRMQFPHKWVAVHCTHGFNRTGYMIASVLVRVLGLSLHKAVGIFAQHRPAGIYKDEYIRALYKYYHEPLPANYQPPALPDWKLEEPDSPKIDHELDAEGDGPEEAEPHELHHDDDIGEEIPLAEAQDVCRSIVHLVRGMAPDDFMPENWMSFPGSQPVSLDRQNLGLLRQERYAVTWKADGTRYMLLIQRWGTYLVDRSFKVRRVQMRFPIQPMADRHPEYQPHHMTLLDGELIVDEERDTGKHTYKFLAYDLMALNYSCKVHKPWKERWAYVDFVVKGRANEKRAIEASMAGGHSYPMRYEYHTELFSIRRKEFWPLLKAKSLLQNFIPTLSHESDGLIFQAKEEPYVVGTDDKLLKWKYGSMNSVDFLLRSKAAGPELYLGKGSDIALLPGAKVEFAEGEDVRKYENCIVECAFDGEEGVWRFMRARTDKQRPNAWHVYEKVMTSIQDNIEEDDIIAEVEEAMKSPVYEKDRPPGAPQHSH